MSSESDTTQEEEVNPKESKNIRHRIDCTVCLVNIPEELAILAGTDCSKVEEIIKQKEQDLALKLARHCFEGTLRLFGKKASISDTQPVAPKQYVDADTTDEYVNESIPNGEVSSSQPDPIDDPILTGAQNPVDQSIASQLQVNLVLSSVGQSSDLPVNVSNTAATVDTVPVASQNGISLDPHSDSSDSYESAPEDPFNSTPEEMKLRNSRKKDRIYDDPSKLEKKVAAINGVLEKLGKAGTSVNGNTSATTGIGGLTRNSVKSSKDESYSSRDSANSSKTSSSNKRDLKEEVDAVIKQLNSDDEEESPATDVEVNQLSPKKQQGAGSSTSLRSSPDAKESIKQSTPQATKSQSSSDIKIETKPRVDDVKDETKDKETKPIHSKWPVKNEEGDDQPGPRARRQKAATGPSDGTKKVKEYDSDDAMSEFSDKIDSVIESDETSIESDDEETSPKKKKVPTKKRDRKQSPRKKEDKNSQNENEESVEDDLFLEEDKPKTKRPELKLNDLLKLKVNKIDDGIVNLSDDDDNAEEEIKPKQETRTRKKKLSDDKSDEGEMKPRKRRKLLKSNSETDDETDEEEVEVSDGDSIYATDPEEEEDKGKKNKTKKSNGDVSKRSTVFPTKK